MTKKLQPTNNAVETRHRRYYEGNPERIAALLLEGLDSGEPIPVTPEYWEAKKQKLAERLGKAIRPQ